MLAVADVEQYFMRSAVFQERLETADPELVAKHIYYCESEFSPDPDPSATLASLRPFLVLAPERLVYQAGSEGDSTILYASGGVVAVVSDNPTQGKNNKESFRDYWGWVSAVMDEISAMERTDDHFRFEFSLAIPPWRPALTERPGDDFWESVFLFTYGAGK